MRRTCAVRFVLTGDSESPSESEPAVVDRARTRRYGRPISPDCGLRFDWKGREGPLKGTANHLLALFFTSFVLSRGLSLSLFCYVPAILSFPFFLNHIFWRKLAADSDENIFQARGRQRNEKRPAGWWWATAGRRRRARHDDTGSQSISTFTTDSLTAGRSVAPAWRNSR